MTDPRLTGTVRETLPVHVRCLAARWLTGLAAQEAYLDPDGRPYERLCPWG